VPVWCEDLRENEMFSSQDELIAISYHNEPATKNWTIY